MSLWRCLKVRIAPELCREVQRARGGSERNGRLGPFLVRLRNDNYKRCGPRGLNTPITNPYLRDICSFICKLFSEWLVLCCTRLKQQMKLCVFHDYFWNRAIELIHPFSSLPSRDLALRTKNTRDIHCSIGVCFFVKVVKFSWFDRSNHDSFG